MVKTGEGRGSCFFFAGGREFVLYECVCVWWIFKRVVCVICG